MFDFFMIRHPHNRASFGNAKTFQGKASGNESIYRCTHSIVPAHCTQKVPRTLGNAFKRAITSAENVKREKLKSRKTISKGL